MFLKRSLSGGLSLVVALTLVPRMAQAQQHQAVEASPAFRTVLQSPEHQSAVLRALKQSTVWQRHGCADATFTVLKVVIYKAPAFDAAGKPIVGAWGEKVRATGCGTSLLLNAVTQVRSPGVLVSGALAPGETTADPILQRDASFYARPVAMRGHAGCKDAYLENTEILNKTAAAPPDATGPVRFERWTVFVCGSIVAVELMFTPDKTGTSIVAYASKP
jgi:hypothetical protein